MLLINYLLDDRLYLERVIKVSLFLGKIHYSLYNKIKIQDALTGEVALGILGEDFSEKMDLELGVLPSGDLKDIVDENNIHGSLQGFIVLIEERLAYTLGRVIDLGYEDRALKLVKNFGIKIRNEVENQRELFYYYEVLNSIFVNGMPCDGANQVISEDDDKLIYKTNRDIFIDYYSDEKLEKFHKDIKVALGNGVFEEVDVKMNNLEEDYFLIRRV